MARIYGDVAGSAGFRAYLDYTITETATTYRVDVKGGIQAYTKAISHNGSSSAGTINGYVYVGSTPYQKTVTDYSIAKGAVLQVDDDYVTYTKGTSSVSHELQAVMAIVGDGTSTVNLAVTVPALASYAVTFNANGGTGAPSAQTKYYGKTLTLSKTKPTRTGYKFVKWNTKADGSGTSYNSGGSYTANAAVTLYAIWEWIYVPHKISNLSAVRCDSSGTASDTGAYAKVTFNWTKAVLESGQVNPSAIKVGYKLSAASTYTYASVSDLTSGTASIIIGGNLTEDNSYDVIAVVSASGHTDVTKETYISSSYFCMDVSPDGRAVAFGRSAPENKEGVFFGLPPHIDVNTTATTGIDANITAALDALGWTSAVISNKNLDVKLLLQKLLNIRIVEVTSSTFSINANGYLHLVVPLPSSGTAIAVVGWYITGTTNTWGNIYEYTLTSAGGDFRIKNLNQTDAMSCQLTARYLVIG